MPRQVKQTIWVHPAAPNKPKLKQTCNGCGLCCLATPCPIARIWIWQHKGACRALTWQDQQQRYYCGLIQQTKQHIPWLPQALIPLAQAYFKRSIASNTGCDFDADQIDTPDV